ncbi:hypothetical protein OAI75_01410 [Woeseiaceae bacterium]|nr:hypothetical protein [Woeseiaceae bacterium]
MQLQRKANTVTGTTGFLDLNLVFTPFLISPEPLFDLRQGISSCCWVLLTLENSRQLHTIKY